MTYFPYQERDLTFGQEVLKFRELTGLTQSGLGQYLGLSRRAISEWEVGNSFPKTPYLKQLIKLALEHGFFEPGREVAQIRTLWQVARQKVVIDETWLAEVLETSKVAPSAPPQTPPPTPPKPVATLTPRQTRLDWHTAPAAFNFYGRENELADLKKWLVEEKSRVVSVLGMGGIGKSSLTVTLMRKLASDFEVVIWRSVRDAPEVETLLHSCLQPLAPQLLTEEVHNLKAYLDLLHKELQNRRVLLVLDNFETLLEEGAKAGYLRNGYEGYGRLLRLLAETAHQSCLIITSREKPVELVPLEGARAPVRALRLAPLDTATCEKLLLDKEVSGTAEERRRLSELLTGNPLALKIVGQTIIDLFGGEIAAFLAEGEIIFGGIRKLLDSQFARLSPLEQTVLFWLAILREAVTLQELGAMLLRPAARMELLETLTALHQRSLVERGEIPGSFALQSVVLEYLTSRLVEEVTKELIEGKPRLVVEHCLMQAQAKDYIRQSQIRVIIQPLLERFDGQINRLEHYLRNMLAALRQLPKKTQGYAGGNVLNLLVVNGSQLAGWDFSELKICQAHLAGLELHNLNLAGCDLSNSVFTEGFNSIIALAYSPNGQYLAGGSLSGEIKVWHLNSQAGSSGYILQLECRGHRELVTVVAYSPDGKMLASGSRDYTVRLWDAESGENILTLEGHTATVQAVAFSPDGQFVASGSYDNTIQLWRIATGERVATLEGNSGWVWSVAFSPDNQLVASGNADGTMKLWQAGSLPGSYQLMTTLTGHVTWVMRLAFSPDGQTLYSCGADSTVRVWSVERQEQLQILAGHTGSVYALAVSPNGSVLATSGIDRSIRLWQTNGGNLQHILSGHTAPVTALAFSPNNRTLASSSADRSVRFWSVQGGENLARLQGHIRSIWSIAVSPDGDYLASTGSNNRVLFWQLAKLNLQSSQEFTPQKVLKGHTNQVFSVTFSQINPLLASAGFDRTIRLWSATGDKNGYKRFTLSGHTENVTSLVFSPTANTVVSGSVDGTVRLWSTLNGELIATLEGHKATVRAVAFSPDGNVLASGGNDGTIRLWDGNSGAAIASFGSQPILITSLAYHPAGQLLACAKYDGTIEIWQTEDTTQPWRILKGHQGAVYSVAFSPDGNTLASGGIDGTLHLWDFERGEEVGRFEYGGTVRSVAFTPDGKSVFSAGESGLIKLCDIATGELVATFCDFDPYQGVNITNATGLTVAQRTNLLALGAVEE